MAAITEQDIFTAAAELTAEDIKPTQTTVRERLGGGSYATIGPALRRWKAVQWEQNELAAVELPSELAEALQALGGQLWQTATNLAEARTTAERTAYEDARKELEQELAESADVVVELEAALAEKSESLDVYRTQLSEAEMRISTFEKAQAAAEASALKSEAVHEERASQLQERLADAQKLIERLTPKSEG